MVDKYQYRVGWSADDEVYVARVAEFASLAAHGDSPEEALRQIQDVVSAAVEDLHEHGETPPEPLHLRSYSGRLNLRMPQYLHRTLALEAPREGLSLNQLILLKLARVSRSA